MNNDYLRHIAKELKDAGVDIITPDQLDDLAYHLDIEKVSKQLEVEAEPDNFDQHGNRINRED